MCECGSARPVAVQPLLPHHDNQDQREAFHEDHRPSFSQTPPQQTPILSSGGLLLPHSQSQGPFRSDSLLYNSNDDLLDELLDENTNTHRIACEPRKDIGFESSIPSPIAALPAQNGIKPHLIARAPAFSLTNSESLSSEDEYSDTEN